MFEGVSDCNGAEALKGLRIWVPADAVDVAEDEYLWEDLIGCEVRTAGDERLLGTAIVAIDDLTDLFVYLFVGYDDIFHRRFLQSVLNE